MTIANEIKKKIREKGGAVQNVKDIASGVKALNTNPVFTVTVTADTSEGAEANTYVADKTAKEIVEAHNNGFVCRAVLAEEPTIVFNLGGVFATPANGPDDEDRYGAEFQSLTISTVGSAIVVAYSSIKLKQTGDNTECTSEMNTYSGLTAMH